MVDWKKVPPQDRRLKPRRVKGQLDLGELGIIHAFSYPVRTDSAATYLQDLLRELLDLWRKEVERLLGDLPPTISREALALIQSQVLQDVGRQIIKERRERPATFPSSAVHDVLDGLKGKSVAEVQEGMGAMKMCGSCHQMVIPATLDINVCLDCREKIKEGS